MFRVMYISVQSCCRSETVLGYHHTSSLLCGKILTTPTVILLEYGFITVVRLEAKNAKSSDLNDYFKQYHVFPKLGKHDNMY